MTAHYFDISMWWGIRCSVSCSALVLGLLMGIPTLRLRADYLAIVTIAIAEVIRLIVRSVRFRQDFGGTDGISTLRDESYRDLNPFDANGQRYGVGPVAYTRRTRCRTR